MVAEVRKLLVISGVPIDDLSMPEVLDTIESFILRGKATNKTSQVATVNADFIAKAHTDPELRRILQEADMAIADGRPLMWGARLMGVPLSPDVSSEAILPALLERSEREGYSIYFLGANADMAMRTAQILQTYYPSLKVAGSTSPGAWSSRTPSPRGKLRPEVNQDLLQELANARPDILLVGLGSPEQEKWINMYASRLPIPVMIGIGEALDPVEKPTTTVPKWVEQARLNRVYNLLRQLRLARRYLVDVVGFSVFVARQGWIVRHPLGPQLLLPWSDVIVVDKTAVLRVNGRMDRSNTAEFARKAHEALVLTPSVVVNLAKVDFMDSSAIGTLVSLAKQARESGGDVALACVQPSIAKILTALKLDHFFEQHATVDAAKDSLQARPVSPQAASHHTGEWVVMPMPHRLDAVSSQKMTKDCLARLATNPRLVLDFEDTAFLSSAGLEAMLHVSREAKSKSGEVRIAGCHGDVLRTMQLTRFDKTLPVYPSAKQATS
jgi:N-acetylglucosaminyldiphosphoundecaprenol N-acetyl-beta-D-mannosaminyltransferase